MEIEGRREELIKSYLGLVGSYLQGFIRFASARIAALSLQNVVLLYRSHLRVELSEHPYTEVLRRVDGITLREYKAFEYLYDLSSLVYLTTLLDTFLSDTTKFLLLLHPRAIGTNQMVSLEAVLGAKSTADLLNDAAAKKTREVSYLPFAGRIDFLRQRFGLRLDLGEATMAQLEHYSSLRNTAIHDQAVFDCSIDAEGRISLQQKTCMLHPTPIRMKDVTAAEIAYRTVVRATCYAVVGQVLKAPDHPGFKAIRSLFEDEESRSPTADVVGTAEAGPQAGGKEHAE